ncbi:Alpha/Beta hydrolase protein [Desarmillaria tabescens]|uniref:Alpha/Beta hydrolase protein n=1 Tax=Armillaria tabescens TaxID=1929756 RepID=A0AA39K1W1_ARMTA|nr:Alpha/Beta hydrolase protein [Desarmillaria tabescens]KAK0452980.1 Alpha/Beta hydrolase protein [Desarmillaria tabescens]
MSHITQSLMLTSADGTKIYADASGDSTKPAIVFIHGVSLSSVVWNDIFCDTKWTDLFYLVRYDTRGHGRSGMPTSPSAWESQRLAEDFDAVVEGFNLRRPFVLGWSLGGLCASVLVAKPLETNTNLATHIVDILALHPGKEKYLSGAIHLTGVPFMGPGIGQAGTQFALGCLPSLNQTNDVEKFQDASRRFVNGCSKHASFELKSLCLGNFVTQPRAVTKFVFTREQDATEFFRAGENGFLPLLAIACTDDLIVNGRSAASALGSWKNLKVVDIEGADHMPWLSHSEAMRGLIADWVKGVLDS